MSAGAAPGLLTEGSNRCSISVKRPSGGTNDNVFDWMKRLSLPKVVRSVRLDSGPRGYEPDARVKRRLDDRVRVGEREK